MKPVFAQTASFAKELIADFAGSISKIAQAGYDGIELFNGIYGGMTAQELKTYLAALGLSAIGAHVYVENFGPEIEYLSTLGAKYIVCPGLHIHSYDEALCAAETLNAWGAKSQSANLMVGYHNHHNDFDAHNDRTVIDLLIENTDPSLVTFELDAAWACRAGYDAAAFMQSHPGRFQLVHCKETSRALQPDENPANLLKGVVFKDGVPQLTPEQRVIFHAYHETNVALGQGIINVPAILHAANTQKTCHYIVEREFAYTGDIFSSMANDLAYMRTL